MNRILIVIITLLVFSSCKDDDPLTIVLPKDYLPAYPGSYWEYTNGERVTVHPYYVAHSYEDKMNSTKSTTEKLVPQIGNQYLYEYSITQNSTLFPLKQLLSEKVSSSWVVNDINNQKLYRKTIGKIDSMLIKIPADNVALDSTMYYDILIVVEYTDSLGAAKWNTKEYYSKNVGLIRVEVNNPYDELDPVVQKQIIGLPYINN